MFNTEGRIRSLNFQLDYVMKTHFENLQQTKGRLIPY